MTDQIDISRQTCATYAHQLHTLAKPFGKPSTEGLLIEALRAALDAAEAAIRALAPPPHARAQEVEALVKAAQGVITRWDSPDWKSGHTLDHITNLRIALAPFTKAKP